MTFQVLCRDAEGYEFTVIVEAGTAFEAMNRAKSETVEVIDAWAEDVMYYAD